VLGVPVSYLHHDCGDLYVEVLAAASGDSSCRRTRSRRRLHVNGIATASPSGSFRNEDVVALIAARTPTVPRWRSRRRN
jgi:hypothetical protein